jgi:hypothetical protein
MQTNDLIENLAKDLAPVRPLRRPGLRAASWLAGAAVYVAALTALMPQSSAALAGGGSLLPVQLAAVATGVLAALAAFASVVPAYSRGWFALAAVAAGVWVGVLVGTAPQAAAQSPILGETREWLCIAQILLGGAPLLVLLGAMLRRGAPLNPALTAALAALAVGILANVGACYSHPHGENGVTLVWHGGAIVALVLAAAVGGRFVLRWRGQMPAQ